MKCTNIIVVMMLVMVSLAACGGAGAAATVEAPDNAGNSGGTALDTSYEGALPVMNQLALGSLLLDDTGQALSAEQAARLLPLWQALRGVLSSQNPAQAEIDALLKQIEPGLTADQIAAIRDMRLTQSSLFEWAQSNGVSLGGAFGPGGGPGGGQDGGFAGLRATIQAGGEIPPEIQATIEARRAQGGGPFGTLSPEAQATFQAQGGPGGFRGVGATLALLDRLIEVLTARVNG